MYPPVFNTYHHMFFSNGYAYAPQPQEPFQPISPPNVGLFMPNGTTQDIGSPSAAGQRPGELGAGPWASMNTFWFNVYGGYFGCDDQGPEECTMTVTGFTWSKSTQAEVEAVEEIFSLPPCPGFKNCALTYYPFVQLFSGLSGLQIKATIGSEARIFFLDNLEMGWYNNSCAAGLERIQS